MKRLKAEKWQEAFEEHKNILLQVMDASGETSPIACAVPMAKEMSAHGHSPMMLLAAATEMVLASNAELSDSRPL